MAIMIAFLLGISNFALHQAVLDSHHPLFERYATLFRLFGGRFSLPVEFGILLATMLLIAWGATVWASIYVGYSLSNGVAAWLILSRRI